MRKLSWAVVCVFTVLGFAGSSVRAQTVTFPQPEWFREVMRKAQYPGQLPGPEHLRDYVVDGKLRLTLEQAVQLALVNDPDFHVDELSYQNARFAILRAYSPFDPLFNTTLETERSVEPTSSELSGAQTLISTTGYADFNYTQLFQTGTQLTIDGNGTRSSNNDTFNTFNPFINATVTVTAAQPLLRNCCLAINRAPILIAQRNLKQARATFAVQISTLISQVIGQYWSVVFDNQSLVVTRKALDEAQATYDHDKRQLELGGLAPGDIYRSEAAVATDRVQLIQAEYALKTDQDTLRRLLGADQDSNIAAMDLDLIESPIPGADLLTVDAASAYQQALANRPELESARQQLAVDDINIRVARNELLPNLNVTGFYSSNGLGGNAIDTSVTPPVVVSFAGLAQALDQIGSLKYPTYGVTLQLGLPIRNHQAEADYGSGEVTKTRDLYSLRSEQEQVRLDSVNAVHNLEQSKLTMEAAKIQRDLEQKTLDYEQRKYELGSGTLYVLLQTQTDLATAELNLVSAQINYQRALAGLDLATGTILDKHHVVIRDPK